MSAQSDFMRLTGVLLVAVVCAFGFRWWIDTGGMVGDRFGLLPGDAAPPIRAAGWLNGTPENMDVMTGKVRVVIAWATWCGICRHHVPEQKDAYAKFHDRGVEFIGLTDEAGADMSLVESFVNNAGIPWPNGYGAVETLREYGVADRRPGVWVVGADGIITWNYGMSGTLEKAIEQALKADG